MKCLAQKRKRGFGWSIITENDEFRLLRYNGKKTVKKASISNLPENLHRRRWLKMASEERSISGGNTKGSSRIDGEPISSIPSKRSSDETRRDSSKRQKIVFDLKSKESVTDCKKAKGNAKPGIQIKLNSQKNNTPVPPVKSRPTAAIFNNDDDDEEPEEMPPEARMRMRNIGRDTPTSAGPNSFGKTKQGFCDSKKVFEKSLKAAIEKASSE